MGAIRRKELSNAQPRCVVVPGATLDAHPAVALLAGGADNTVLRERSEKTMAAEVFFRYYFDAH